jgi:hypothetical protein
LLRWTTWMGKAGFPQLMVSLWPCEHLKHWIWTSVQEGDPGSFIRCCIFSYFLSKRIESDV